MLLDVLRKRRSVRRFTDQPVEQDKLDILIEGMLRSPSSKGINPWEFIVISEPKIMAQLANSKPHGAAFLKNAPLAIVVCADASKTDVWVEDASIASIILHLLATDLRLGSCWVQIRLRDHDEQLSSQNYLRDLLHLKDNIMVEAIIGIGYMADAPPGHPQSSLLYDRVFYEKYGLKKK